jgi:hypothetical protein
MTNNLKTPELSHFARVCHLDTPRKGQEKRRCAAGPGLAGGQGMLTELSAPARSWPLERSALSLSGLSALAHSVGS